MALRRYVLYGYEWQLRGEYDCVAGAEGAMGASRRKAYYCAPQIMTHVLHTCFPACLTHLFSGVPCASQYPSSRASKLGRHRDSPGTHVAHEDCMKTSRPLIIGSHGHETSDNGSTQWGLQPALQQPRLQP